MTAAPKRIQRKRTKGWRMPVGAVYVGRRSNWGNPFKSDDRAADVADYRRMLTQGAYLSSMLRELRGKDLACWCAPDQPCHADVLLEIANRQEPK